MCFVSGWNFTALKQPLLIALKDVQSLVTREDVARVLVCQVCKAAVQAVVRDLQLLIDFYPSQIPVEVGQ